MFFDLVEEYHFDYCFLKKQKPETKPDKLKDARTIFSIITIGTIVTIITIITKLSQDRANLYLLAFIASIILA